MLLIKTRHYFPHSWLVSENKFSIENLHLLYLLNRNFRHSTGQNWSTCSRRNRALVKARYTLRKVSLFICIVVHWPRIRWLPDYKNTVLFTYGRGFRALITVEILNFELSKGLNGLLLKVHSCKYYTNHHSLLLFQLCLPTASVNSLRLMAEVIPIGAFTEDGRYVYQELPSFYAAETSTKRFSYLQTMNCSCFFK